MQLDVVRGGGLVLVNQIGDCDGGDSDGVGHNVCFVDNVNSHLLAVKPLAG